MVFIVALRNELWICPVTNADRLILPADDALIGRLLREPNVTVTYRSSNLAVLVSTCSAPSTVWRNGSSGWTRVFEHTYMAPVSDDIARGHLVAEFFNWLGDRYELEIDPTRNIACYEFLFSHAQEIRSHSSCATVLDIGCGPGTILGTTLPAKVPMIRGFDIGDEVRLAAHNAGLPILTEDEFHSGRQDTHVALSAYVMHYACDMHQTLTSVARHLAPGGVWVMNFHKGMNSSLFMAWLPGAGLRLASDPHDSPFGLIVAVAT